jgi:hypothetical protein
MRDCGIAWWQISERAQAALGRGLDCIRKQRQRALDALLLGQQPPKLGYFRCLAHGANVARCRAGGEGGATDWPKPAIIDA